MCLSLRRMPESWRALCFSWFLTKFLASASSISSPCCSLTSLMYSVASHFELSGWTAKGPAWKSLKARGNLALPPDGLFGGGSPAKTRRVQRHHEGWERPRFVLGPDACCPAQRPWPRRRPWRSAHLHLRVFFVCFSERIVLSVEYLCVCGG